MPGNNTVKLDIQVSEKMGDLKKRIETSNLPTDKKNARMAEFTQAQALLAKGTNATAKDMNKASTLINNIIKDLVKAEAGIKGIPKELEKLQKTLEKQTAERNKLIEANKMSKVDKEGNATKSYLNQLAREQNVLNNRSKTGETIKSYDTLLNQANNGNLSAKTGLENIAAIINGEAANVRSRETQISALNADIKNTSGQINALGNAEDPTNSAAVKMQEFGNELDKLISQLKNYNLGNETVGNSNISESSEETANPTKDIEKFNKNLEKQPGIVGKAIKQMTIYGLVIRNVKTAIRSAVKTVQDLDKYLTEQAMVTGKTREQTYALLKSYQDIAKAAGATTKEVAQVSTQFMRQGKTAKEALELTEAAISAAKVAGISATESVNYLTTALNGFQMSASEAMKVSDKFAAVAATSATSYDELATALSKVASQANLAGMSIDYTTALLAKGLETTREAPETMGTALKTIIARMRELTDYGETLAGDTDINNVETQLAYVGIELKNQAGELRSTEDVLDELGKKWDTLNSNQQAAVAKALAGTRQQSRLIAMMTDYERVTELQEVAQRSQGATLAQMGTYMEGMEAALNKIKIAWEEIVTNLTDNEFIVKLINGASSILDLVASVLENEWASFSVIGLIGGALLTNLGIKLKQRQIQKQEFVLSQNQHIQTLKQVKAEKEAKVQKIKTAIEANKNLVIEQKTTLEVYKREKNTKGIKEQKALIKSTTKEQISLEKDLIEAEKESNLANDKFIVAKNEQLGLVGQIGTSISGWISPLLTVISLTKSLTLFRKKDTAATNAQTAATEAGAQAEKQKAGGVIAGNVGKYGISGAIAALAILAAVGIGIAVTIGAIAKSNKEVENASDDMNELSSKIYTVVKRADELENIVNSFERIDNKVLKTNADLKEMNELLENASDSLTDEQQKIYEGLSDNKKLEYLQKIIKESRQAANDYRLEQYNIYDNLSTANKKKEFLDTNSEWIYGINNNTINEYLETLDEVKEGTQELSQQILEKLSTEDALSLINNKSAVKELVKTINDLGTANALTSDDATLTKKIEAYSTTLHSLSKENAAAFKLLYNEFDAFVELSDNSNGKITEYIEKVGLTTDKLNDLYSAYQQLNKIDGIEIEKDRFTSNINALLENLANGSSINDSVNAVFGGLINNLKAAGGEWEDAWNQIVNTVDNALSTTVLNIGQNLDSFTNQINNFYEKASEWSTMSETDKTAFLTDNAELFKDSAVYEAFLTGDYNKIYQAISTSENMMSLLEKRRQELDTKLQIERARVGEARNETLIAYLEDQKALLDDTENLFKASLELRLKQEQSQLAIYKDYLNKQKEALEESLNDKKEAYQKYFDAINQEAEDEDYEENVNNLLTNLSKISTSTDSQSQQARKNLEQQLQDLEEERLKTLRERAQEEVITDIDDQLTEISEKFDTLLESNQAMLEAMTKEMTDPNTFLSNILASASSDGQMTELEMQNFIQELQTAFSSSDLMSGIDWSNISGRYENNQLILNVNGKTVTLSQDDQSNVYDVIMNLMRQMGVS